MNALVNPASTQYSDWIARFLMHPTHLKFSTSPNPIFQAAPASLYFVQRLTVDHKPDGYRDMRRILMSNAYVAPVGEAFVKAGYMREQRVPDASGIGWDYNSKLYRYLQIDKMIDKLRDLQERGERVPNRAVDATEAAPDRPVAYRAALGERDTKAASSSGAVASSATGRSNIYDTMKSATDLELP